VKDFFRIIAFLEGTSYIVLLFIAVPIKYLLQNEFYVKMLGMPHGILFMLYILLAFMIKSKMNWNLYEFMMVVISSVIPFGTFYVDRKYLRLNK
tara:strand:+ start:551 stop:832 length:282 start_codon:yes stop_codon:yes gene_type:complete